MKTPHKHAALIKQWADGAKIEYKTKTDTEWRSLDFPGAVIGWHDYCDYRVKPEPKPDIVEVRKFSYVQGFGVIHEFSVPPNIQLIFDGETGELKDCQVLAQE